MLPPSPCPVRSHRVPTPMVPQCSPKTDIRSGRAPPNSMHDDTRIFSPVSPTPTPTPSSTRRLQRDFLNLLADRRPVSRSEARRLCQPFYALTFPYQAHECREAVNVFRRRLDRLVNSTPGGLREVLPDFLSGGITDRPNSTTDAAYHVLLGAKYVGQRCHRGAAIAMGVGRDKRSCFQHSNGLSSTFSMAFEHAFLEDVCRPPTRLFADAVSCDTYDSVHTQSYAGRAFLPCIERDDTERRKAIRAVRRHAFTVPRASRFGGTGLRWRHPRTTRCAPRRPHPGSSNGWRRRRFSRFC